MSGNHHPLLLGENNLTRASQRSFTSLYQSIGGPSNVQALKESRRGKNQSVVSQEIVDQQKELAETKNEFLKEKGMERHTIRNMITKLKTQTNQVKKQTRQIENKNKQLEDETADLEKAVRGKLRKSLELTKQREDLQKGIADLDRDVRELDECKAVLTTELAEEHAYQEQMRNLIAQLKRNIYEVKNEREKFVKEINQERKIYANLQRMHETVAEDNEKLRSNFQVAFEKNARADRVPRKHDISTASQIKTNVSTISKLSTTGRKKSCPPAKNNPTNIAKMKPLRF